MENKNTDDLKIWEAIFAILLLLESTLILIGIIAKIWVEDVYIHSIITKSIITLGILAIVKLFIIFCNSHEID